MVGLIERVCRGPEGDERLMRRFTRQIEQAGVTHLLPMLSILGPWVAAARSRIERPLDYLVTFQGYELYVNYAREIGREETLYEKLREAVGRSSYPAIAVSRDYADRVVEDLGIPAASLQAIPPGVPTEFGFDPARAREVIRQSGLVGPLDLDTPLVTFLGRRDTEKGIDLLLYAAAILRRRGLKFHLAVCGPTLFGDHYSRVCRQLAVDLRIPVTWRNFISDELRSALFTGSRCIVYPSIHREPFGMVAVEALAHGTPCVVPDYGGISAAIEANGRVGGVRFRAWDSADLAAAIERLLTDDELHGRLSAEGPSIATYYSVENLADRVLRHMGLPARPQCATDNPEETD